MTERTPMRNLQHPETGEHSRRADDDGRGRADRAGLGRDRRRKKAAIDAITAHVAAATAA
jgi:hypothetical protein